MTLPARQPLRPTDPPNLGEYTLLGRLGEGGMGTVFLARSAAGRIVAVKSIRHDLSGDPDFRRRFRAEVARAQQVPAYCTAEVLDADPDHEPPYLVVEHVEGPSLSQVVESRGPLSESNLHGLAIAVATALTGIHGAGVIHRDLKPSNVLLSLGSAKVIDFGIARTTDLIDTSATDPHQLIGSVHYMAPERLSPGAAQSLTGAADIFAWGAVVTFAGTGRTPFGGSTVEAAARILLRSPDLTGLHGPLRDLVEQALSKDPNDRPTARELLDRLLSREPKQPGRLIEAGSRQAVIAVATGADTTRLAPATLAPPVSAPPRRTRRRALTVVAGIVVLATVAATLLTNGFGVLGSATPTGTPTSPASAPPPSPSPQAPALVRDALAKPGVFWQNRDDPAAKATCSLTGALVVTQTRKGTYRCPGFSDPLTDFTVSVDVRLTTTDTCAAMWLRFDDLAGGHLLAICGDRFELWQHGKTLAIERTFALPAQATAAGRRVTVTARGDRLTFLHDGLQVGAAQLNTYQKGRIVLGIFVPSNAVAMPAYVVEFTNIEILET